jgi:hypothetical protein
VKKYRAITLWVAEEEWGWKRGKLDSNYVISLSEALEEAT